MADIPMPPDLPSLLADYERRLRALETAPRLQNSALPWTASTITTAEDKNDTGTDWFDLATVGPSVTVTVGQTSRVVATMSVQGFVAAGIRFPSVGLFIDGVLYRQYNSPVGNVTTGFTMAPTLFAATEVIQSTTLLAAGLHTFTLRYKVTFGTSNPPTPYATYGPRTLLVQPF